MLDVLLLDEETHSNNAIYAAHDATSRIKIPSVHAGVQNEAEFNKM